MEVVWGLRDQLTIKHTPATISVVSRDTGALLWQNASSMAMFGGSRQEWVFGVRLEPQCKPTRSQGISLIIISGKGAIFLRWDHIVAALCLFPSPPPHGVACKCPLPFCSELLFPSLPLPPTLLCFSPPMQAAATSSTQAVIFSA